MLLNLVYCYFWRGWWYVLIVRADVSAGDDVKVGDLLCSALFLHDSVNSINSSLCLGFMSSNACFDRVVIRYHGRTVGRREVAVECLVRSPSRGLATVFYKIGKVGRCNAVFGISGQSLWERWALTMTPHVDQLCDGVNKMTPSKKLDF
jgi:hypothetical protein